MTLLIRSTKIVFHLKIDFVIIVVIVIIAVVVVVAVDIVIDKFDFVMTNMYFIFVVINTRYTTSEFKRTLKAKNKRSTENLNENYIHQKFDSYEIVKN